MKCQVKNLKYEIFELKEINKDLNNDNIFLKNKLINIEKF